MKAVVWRVFMDYEKEEKWLNEMSSKGWAFTDFLCCRYVFEKRECGEYIYRLELLDNLPSHPASRAYIEFMEGAGAEQVGSHLRWVYFRKKAADGPFDIYTDTDSKISHYKRISWMFTIILLANTVNLSNLLYRLVVLQQRYPSGGLLAFEIVFGIFFLTVYGLIIKLLVQYQRKIKKLKKEKLLRG